jgi:hypothetical protein
MCTEVSKSRAVAAHQGVSTFIIKAFDWKHSRISMLEVEAQSCIP